MFTLVSGNGDEVLHRRAGLRRHLPRRIVRQEQRILRAVVDDRADRKGGRSRAARVGSHLRVIDVVRILRHREAGPAAGCRRRIHDRDLGLLILPERNGQRRAGGRSVLLEKADVENPAGRSRVDERDPARKIVVDLQPEKVLHRQRQGLQHRSAGVDLVSRKVSPVCRGAADLLGGEIDPRENRRGNRPRVLDEQRAVVALVQKSHDIGAVERFIGLKRFLRRIRQLKRIRRLGRISRLEVEADRDRGAAVVEHRELGRERADLVAVPVVLRERPRARNDDRAEGLPFDLDVRRARGR